jgi:hypothetical protein
VYHLGLWPSAVYLSICRSVNKIHLSSVSDGSEGHLRWARGPLALQGGGGARAHSRRRHETGRVPLRLEARVRRASGQRHHPAAAARLLRTALQNFQPVHLCQGFVADAQRRNRWQSPARLLCIRLALGGGVRDGV